jgi:hypothetical protein
VSQPRNVTPGYSDDRAPDGTFPKSGRGDPPQGTPPEWFAWTWTQSRESTLPWLGLLLVMVGAGLLIQYFVPSISATTLALAALSIAFLAGGFMGRATFLITPGLLLGALVVARLIDELNIYTGPGATAIALAVAFLLIYGIGAMRGRRRPGWALWGAAIFGLIGVVQISGRIASIPELGGFWPAAILVVGLLLLINNARRGPRSHPPTRY